MYNDNYNYVCIIIKNLRVYTWLVHQSTPLPVSGEWWVSIITKENDSLQPQ